MLTIKSEIKEQKLDGTYNVKFFLSIFLKGVVGYAERHGKHGEPFLKILRFIGSIQKKFL